MIHATRNTYDQHRYVLEVHGQILILSQRPEQIITATKQNDIVYNKNTTQEYRNHSTYYIYNLFSICVPLRFLRRTGFSESVKYDFTIWEIHISKTWKSMLSESVKLQVSQSTTPD